MPRFIVLPCIGSAADAPVFATALAVARKFSSHLAFLHVRPDVRQEFAALAASEVGAVSGIGDTMERMERDADQREHAAEQQWRELCQREQLAIRDGPAGDGVSTEWIGEVGDDTAWVAEHGRTADLIIAGHGGQDDGIAMGVLEAALLESGRPVLVAPPTAPASVGRVVTIAWKGRREAAGAVSAGLPFIAQAERVIILTIDEGDDADDRSPERLQRALRWHNPAVLMHRLVHEQGSVAETLLAAAMHAESDLLVMGGYGQTRLHEAVFGSFTRHVLERAELPVLMAH
ncbi:MAG TPA: universal stress protein [Acetobacteraceae bacterium]|jgi:nucleotide-binding universal stress UspA family protein|nr:universal stress protein [Acetobacteraceae bacterium]